jgi:hypothetical protein
MSMSKTFDITSVTSGHVEEELEIPGVGGVTFTSGIVEPHPKSDNEGFIVLVEITPRGATDSPDALRTYVNGLKDVLSHVLREPTQLARLVEQLSPHFEPPSPALLLQARRNAEARRDLLHDYGAFTAATLADANGSSASNRAALASRWRKESRIFGVTSNDKTYFPSFQFDDRARPLAVVGRVLSRLRTEPMGEWEIALWFTSANEWLSGRRPVDLLKEDPDGVVAAAEHEIAPIAG